MSRVWWTCLAVVMLAGCETSEDERLRAEERVRTEQQMLDSLEDERELLIRDHEDRLDGYTDQRKIAELKQGHRSDLRRVEEEIGRQREHLEWVTSERDGLAETD